MTSLPAGWSSASGRWRNGMGGAAALRHTLLWASRRTAVQRAVSASPLTRRLVRRFVAGEAVDGAVAAARRLTAQGLLVSIDHLGEDTRDAEDAGAVVAEHRALVDRLVEEGLTEGVELSLKLSSLGLGVDPGLALENADAVCRAAGAAGIAVTIDMEDHTATDATLDIGERLRADHPDVGLVIQASLRRSEADCRRLAHPGSRVRICKGAYQEPADLAWQGRNEIRAAYIRCLRHLALGGAHPLVATHDPALIEASHRILALPARAHVVHEHQMLLGVRPDEQSRLAATGEAVRVYVPYGDRWYPYLMRRIAERPANLALVLRALGSRG
jgi:proline dehydrogenase